MTIYALKVFLKVCETGSFSSASNALFTTPSAINQKMQSLEQELGFKLFERNYKGVILTESGELFRLNISKILEEFDDTIEKCKTISSQNENHLNIGVHTNSLLAAYSAYPKNQNISYSYHIYTENDSEISFNLLRDGALDILEWSSSRHLSKLQLSFLSRYEDHAIAIVSANSFSSLPKEIDLFDSKLQNRIYVYSHKWMSGIEEELQELNKNESKIEYKTINNPNNIIHVCENGGIVLVGSKYASTLPLCSLLIKQYIPVRFGLIYKTSCSESVKSFISFVKEFDKTHTPQY